jgi:amino acid transporter
MRAVVEPSRSSSAGGVVKRLLVGRALATHKAEHQLLPKVLALPVFSSDPLSSNAYATEEMMLVLVTAGAVALQFAIPIAIAIAGLLLIVVTSYRQTVRAYPMGGGSYIVAKENLGTMPGLIAAAAILTDYVLTVSVSVTAGTVAITAVAPETLGPWSVPIAVGLILMIMVANLRGVREAGTLFAIPTYGFVLMVLVTMITGLVRCLSGCPVAATSDLPLHATTTVSLFLILRAFSSGSTALTGVEAIADGVQAFRRPQARNAAATLLAMGTMSVTMFLGITVLAKALQVRVNEEIASSDPVLAQIGKTVFDGGFLYLVLQIFTAAILVLAANTAFQDFPRLSSILARDGFMPSQFRNRGDKLVFSNGVVVLTAFAAFLVVIFDANLTRLIQLYVVGVFTAFTLSQTGMVRRWTTRREEGWRRAAIINGVGAATTGIVLIIVTITKFAKGAWMVIVAIPVIVTIFHLTHVHYMRVRSILRLGRYRADAQPSNTFLLLISEMGPATLSAVAYLRSVRPEALYPYWIGSPDAFDEAALEWRVRAPRLGDLRFLEHAPEHLVSSVRRAVRAHRADAEGFVTVVVPEVVPITGVMRYVLRRRKAFLLKASLLFEPGAVVMDVPLLPGEEDPTTRERPVEPGRSVTLVPISAVHDATVRAIVYARALGAARTEALFLSEDPVEQELVIDDWYERGLEVPLQIVEAPFRELGPPLLAEVRAYTARGDTIVTVVMPEIVPRHWWENLLHNQTTLFMKRLLLFEPHVVVVSVPFHLRHAEVATAAEE